MAQDSEITIKINMLKERHRKLDNETKLLAEMPICDQIKLQRLKKEKLALKDEIAQLNASQVPDIIA